MDDNWVQLNTLGYSKYEVHHSGLVRNKSKKRVLVGRKSKCAEVYMTDDNGINQKNIKVDELVCKTFIGMPSRHDNVVIHINSDYSNSTASNIRWGTTEEKIDNDIKNISLPNEIWKDCSPYGFQGYFASSFGRIFSSRKCELLFGYLSASGYYQVRIMNNEIRKLIFVHVLVCYAFNDNPKDSTYTVDHIDRNRTNNHSNNLRWASTVDQALNRNKPINQKNRIAQIKDGVILDFYDKQSILEIFDVDDIIIPDNGLLYSGYLWMPEKFTNLDLKDERWTFLTVNGTTIKVSNMGRVENKNGKTFGSYTADGYKMTQIANKNFKIHKLVILTFIGDYDENLVINHMDRDKSNNRLDNLEVVTKSQNCIHAVATGTKVTKSVQQFDKLGNMIAQFNSFKEATDITNINGKSISAVVHGKQKTAGGFIWKFTPHN